MEGAHALHQVLLNAPRARHDAVHHLVLNQVADDLPLAARHHVRSVPQEDSASLVGSVLGGGGLLVVPLVEGLLAEAPADHLVDDVDGLTEMRGLQSHGGETPEEGLVVDSVVEVVAPDLGTLNGLVLVQQLLELLLDSALIDHSRLRVVHDRQRLIDLADKIQHLYTRNQFFDQPFQKLTVHAKTELSVCLLV